MNSAPWILAALSSCLVGCSSLHGPSRSQAVPAAPAAAAQDPLGSIARFEDMRSDGDGLLQVLAARGEERTRLRAVRALGRLPRDEYGASVTDALESALQDRAVSVRAAAAFGLGQRGDADATDALLVALRDADGEVRARATEALSRLDSERARQAVLAALDDADVRVREMATLGPARFPASSPQGNVADTDLCAFLLRDGKDPNKPSADERTRWRALFSLGRRKAERARDLFARFATSEDVRERIFAVQGLAAIPPDAEGLAVLRAKLTDADWRVASDAAAALGKHADSRSIDALCSAAQRADPVNAAHHVRRAAVTALGLMQNTPAEQPAAQEELIQTLAARNERLFRINNLARPALVSALKDASPAVRAAALDSLARLAREGAWAEIGAAADAADAVERGGAAAACAHIDASHALPLLDRLLRDPRPYVATAAADALAEHVADPVARRMVRELLANADNGLRLSAATALKDCATSEDMPALERCFESSTGEISAEVAAAVLDAAAKAGGDAGFALLARGASHRDAYVARKARALALAARPGSKLPASPPSTRRAEALPPLAWPSSPRVAIDTSRGTLVFELLPDEAPFHVANLLELARAGRYDGLSFHRVVPDFVVQGGDRRGDGNGGTTWRGDPLRGEFGPRPFRRGSLGMPRNDDPDSGGSQIFVTHRETPHLDGRYTLFGEMVEGFDVLDALQVGDLIVRVRDLPAGG
ncbi:MAG: HEAT repeat domain-containing protein [Planctomycetota bacterium]|nr:HEAT repeat domain-containing protein [Planctomycetota bacterium]